MPAKIISGNVGEFNYTMRCFPGESASVDISSRGNRIAANVFRDGSSKNPIVEFYKPTEGSCNLNPPYELRKALINHFIELSKSS